MPPIEIFAVAEYHSLLGPASEGLAGLNSGMMAPMGISSSREPPDTHEMRRHISAEHRTHRGMLVWPPKAAPGDEEGEGDDSEGDKEGDALAVDPMQGFLMFTSKGAMDPAFMCSSFMYAFRPAAAPAAGSVHGGHPQDLAWMGDKMHIVSG